MANPRQQTQQTEKKERKPVVRRSKGQMAIDALKDVNRALKLALVDASPENTPLVLDLVNQAGDLTIKVREHFQK